VRKEVPAVKGGGGRRMTAAKKRGVQCPLTQEWVTSNPWDQGDRMSENSSRGKGREVEPRGGPIPQAGVNMDRANSREVPKERRPRQNSTQEEP